MDIQTIINDVIINAKNNLQQYMDNCFQASIPLCDLKIDYSGDGPDYKDLNIQHLYVLRYFYAYINEFREIYRFIHLDVFKIISIGCGINLDLLGLISLPDNETKEIRYCGIDPVSWADRSYMNKFIPDSCDICFRQSKFEDFIEKVEGKTELSKANVIIFPKSIEYISTIKWVESLSSIKFEEKIIYLIMNAMDTDFAKDESKIDYLKGLFEEQGYISKWVGSTPLLTPKYFCQFEDSPEYPKDIFETWLPNIWKKCCCSDNCKKKDDCYLYNYNSPITKTDTFRYKIIKLVKDDSQR